MSSFFIRNISNLFTFENLESIQYDSSSAQPGALLRCVDDQGTFEWYLPTYIEYTIPSSQVITASTPTRINLSAEEESRGTAGITDDGAGTFTIQEDGAYHITTTLRVTESSNTGLREHYIVRNGVETLARITIDDTSQFGAFQNLSIIKQLDATDTLEVYYEHTSPGTVTITDITFSVKQLL